MKQYKSCYMPYTVITCNMIGSASLVKKIRYLYALQGWIQELLLGGANLCGRGFGGCLVGPGQSFGG